MPIRPEWRKYYDDAWDKLSVTLKVEAGWRCVGSPRFPRCRAKHGKPHPDTQSVVVLTTAHLDHNPANRSRENLRVWCQRCHNVYDAEFRSRNRAATLRAALNNGELFPPSAGSLCQQPGNDPSPTTCTPATPLMAATSS